MALTFFVAGVGLLVMVFLLMREMKQDNPNFYQRFRLRVWLYTGAISIGLLIRAVTTFFAVLVHEFIPEFGSGKTVHCDLQHAGSILLLICEFAELIPALSILYMIV